MFLWRLFSYCVTSMSDWMSSIFLIPAGVSNSSSMIDTSVQQQAQQSSSEGNNVAAEISPFDLKRYLAVKKIAVDVALDSSLACNSFHPAQRLLDSMRYSLLSGGKRIRPILCIAAAELFGGSEAAAAAMPAAVAVEMIHSMSLIHDDLPAMDNDELRRGKPTNHVMFGEGVAILAGDALLSTAFQHVATQTRGVSAERVLQVLGRLGAAAGANGLAGGQVRDLQCEGKIRDVSCACGNGGTESSSGGREFVPDRGVSCSDSGSSNSSSDSKSSNNGHSAKFSNNSSGTSSSCTSSGSSSSNGADNSSSGSSSINSADILTLEDLQWIHVHKTAALLKVSVAAGAIIAGASAQDVAACETYAEKIGLAFQITDDILDVTATFAELGKTPGKDLKANKATYVTLLGLERSRAEAARLIAEAKEALNQYGDRAIALKEIADFIVARKS